MQRVEFTVPGEPVPAARPRVVRIHGKTIAYTPVKSAKWKENVAIFAKKAMLGKRKLQGPLSVTIRFDMPIPNSWTIKKKNQAINQPHTAKPDIDNLVKNALDALNGIAFDDDKIVARIDVMKVYELSPSTCFCIAELKEE